MVVIAGYREEEYFSDKLEEIKDDILNLLQTFWAGNPMGKEGFFKFLPELLHCFFERVDEEFGIKGDDYIKKKLSKLPFVFFEFPRQYIKVYQALIQLLLSNINQPYNAQRIFKWSKERFVQIYQSIHATLNQIQTHTIVIDPEMPQFLIEIVEQQVNHLGFVKLLKPSSLKYCKALFPQPYPGQTVVITAPYSTCLVNYIQQNYANKKNSQPDNLNAVRTHFAVKRIVDEQSLEVHIYRTPHSMDSESAKNKIDEFRKSTGDEYFEVLGGFCQFDGRVEQVSYINISWIFDSFYFNEWSAISDYGLVELQKRNLRKSEFDAAQEDLEQKIQQHQLLGLQQREDIALIRGWTTNDIQKMENLKQVKGAHISFGDYSMELSTDFDTYNHQRYIDTMVRQAQHSLTIKEQVRLAERMTPRIKTPFSSFDDFLSVAKNFIYNQYYDSHVDQWLKNQIVQRGLQKQFKTKIATVDGVRVQLQEVVQKVADYVYEGPENIAISAPQNIGAMDTIQPFEMQIYDEIFTQTGMSTRNYVCLRNTIIQKSMQCRGYMLTTVEVARFAPLPVQIINNLLQILYTQKLLFTDQQEMSLGFQVYAHDDESQTNVRCGTKEEQKTGYQFQKAINSINECDSNKVVTIVEKDPRLLITNAIIARFDQK